MFGGQGRWWAQQLVRGIRGGGASGLRVYAGSGQIRSLAHKRKRNNPQRCLIVAQIGLHLHCTHGISLLDFCLVFRSPTSWCVYLCFVSHTCFSSSSKSAFSLLAAASCIASSRGSRSTHWMYHPFSVSSTTALPI